MGRRRDYCGAVSELVDDTDLKSVGVKHRVGSSPTRATKGVTMRRSVDKKFFQVWNEKSAYLIGYICADGCIHKRTGRNKSYVLTITSKDRDHLKKISTILKSNYAISRKRSGSGRIAYHVAISNYNLCMSVMGRGVMPNKTLGLGPISVPRSYLGDFIRGFFDADGSVYIYYVNGVPQLKIEFVCASYKFITFITEQLSKRLNIAKKPIHKYLRKDRTNPIYSIVFYINDGQKLYNLMYGHTPELFLERKFQVFNKWKSTKRRKYKVGHDLAPIS